MKLSVLANLYGDKSLEEALRILTDKGIHTVEIGAGGYPGKAHCNPAELLADDAKYREFVNTFEKYDVEICALACHGNPVHPDKATAKAYHDDFVNAILLAERLGVDTIIGFSGCPGDSENSKYPNWVTCPWPDDYLKILDWQWNEVLIPYWKEAARIAESYGVKKIAFEMHPGFCVYNPATLRRLRNAVGDILGANFDPSHLIWQGMDPVAVIRELGGDAIFHVHAKDTRLDKYNMAKNGALDTKSYADEAHRSWIFRSVGYGNDLLYWKDIISALRLVGYDYAISIEHEDSLMSQNEGLQKAIAFLRGILMYDSKNNDVFWA